MRLRLLAYLVIFLPLSVCANPVIIDGSSAIAFGIVALAAFMVEAGVAALALLFSGLAIIRVFVAYFVVSLPVICSRARPSKRCRGGGLA